MRSGNNAEERLGRLMVLAVASGLLVTGCPMAHSAALKDDATRDDARETAALPIPVLDWQPRSDWINVKDFGALGDGAADDTAAIQQGLDQMQPGSTLYLPPGEYRITATLNLTRDYWLRGVMVVGHGRETRLVWDGEEGGAIFHPNGVAYARYVGLVFDGRGRAGSGMVTMGRFYQDQVRHQHLAFLNFTDAAYLIHRDRRHATSEPTFENCYFENNRRGIVLGTYNDYHFTIDGCEFRNNGIGVDASNWGTFYIRNSHFSGSTRFDIVAKPHHGSSVRRTTSVGSNAFMSFNSPSAPMVLQDVHVADWKSEKGAIHLSGVQLTIFDSTFRNSLHSHRPIQFFRGAPKLMLSNNTVEGSDGMVQATPHARFAESRGNIHEIPAGERGASLNDASQRFIRDTAMVPGRVFDAVEDFGAKADGTADDTEAIRNTIDAAREYGRGALAYLPAGTYVIRETLNITGGDYVIGGGGSGSNTRIQWRGPSDSAIMHVHDPQNVTLQHISLFWGDKDAATHDILQTSSGEGSRITYDGVWTWGAHVGQPFKRGFHFRGLGKNDEVLIRFAQGNMRFTDSVRATILVNVKQYAPVIIEGKDEERDGFLGFMSYLATGEPYCLYVRDNLSVVASDFYHEQSGGMFHIAGSAGATPGRITWTGGRSHMYPPGHEQRSDRGLMTRLEPRVGMNIDNYHGEIFLGSKDFSDGRLNRTVMQKGANPVTLFFFGNAFYGVALDVESSESLTLSMLGNQAFGRMHLDYDLKDNVTNEEKAALSRAFDDLRRLGHIDLELNHRRPPAGLFGGQRIDR